MSAVNLDDPSLYINRELSWLEFNRRVLEEAQDPTVPLLERLKFHAIFSSNLDEFFMVRVGGLQQKVLANISRGSGGDKLAPHVQLERIAETVKGLVEQQYASLQKDLLPALREKGIVIRPLKDLTDGELKQLKDVFRDQVFPVLTPLAIDPGHPFPHLLNKSLNLAVVLRRPDDPEPLYAVVQVPGMLPRFVMLQTTKVTPDTPAANPKDDKPADSSSSHDVRLPDYSIALFPLEDVIRLHLTELFPGMELSDAYAFRVTRDSEFEIDDEVDDLMQAIEDSVRKRRRGHASRLEIEAAMTADLEQFLTAALDLNPEDVTRVPSVLDLTGLFQIYALPGFADLRDPPVAPTLVREFVQAPSPWAAIRARDILVHHPYESFKHVVDFIEAAAADDRVQAIKQTLYRTSSDSPVVRALQMAADKGKQVTAVIELKARLDEERNILWARELEKAGVHVVFGFVGLKTHCKVALVVRRDEDNQLRRYVHLGTGNYNPITARTYTDLGFFTCNPDFAADVALLFNHLTGYASLPQWKKLIVAPSRMMAFMLEKIEQEAANAKAGKKGRIRVKINGLIEPAVVKALYAASQAGVKIDIACRGVCSLRPGVPGVSENIRITSVVDRFLEHSRIFYFENDGSPEVYVGSADWMDRNLTRRVEVAFPIEQPDLKARVIDELLKTTLADNQKSRLLLPDGTYERVKPKAGEAELRSQQRFLDLAKAAADRLQTATSAAPQSTPTATAKPKIGPRSSKRPRHS
ncbi:polyphosphate kinase 1 [Limnoglobus roseus]|uniref:Polyphosphate kinase n=1 Tax=Limnoglobus roseus TaxID=2598579 RepID=A0A5C1A4K3_9BACT|nr:polyphosphate kinase 1 [Limnoglobus roseus]QEL13590.1 polyphosphate kinase 1 [Limnoglobus roseus]